MRILVTGTAGFIGYNLSDKLLTEGHQVIGIDNFITSGPQNISTLKKNSRFSFIKQDIIKPLRQIGKIDEIYHLACPTGVPNLTRLAEEMLLTCSLGTKNILELARRHNAPLLFASSSESYGDPLVSPQTEEYTGNVDPVGIRSPYEEGKRFSESLTVMYARKYNLNAKIVRIFNTYGPNMSLDDTRVIPRFLSQSLSGKPLTIHGTGEQKRTFCYVDDLVEGLISVMKKGIKGEVYNLGSDKQITIKELAGKIINLTKSTSKIKHVSRPSHDHQSRLPDLKKVRLLGWMPKTSLVVGLKKTLI